MATFPLRSPSEKIGGLFYFGRMLDKIRLHAKGELPPDYHANLGKGFDEKCVKFLRVNYDDLVERVKEGGCRRGDFRVVLRCWTQTDRGRRLRLERIHAQARLERRSVRDTKPAQTGGRNE